MVKHLPTTRETWVWSLGWEDLLEKETATHSSILAWKIPWMEEPGRLQSMGSQRIGHDWAACTFTHLVRGFPGGTSGKEPTCQCRSCKRCGFDPWVRKIPWRRAQQPSPLFLPEESHGQRSLEGYSPWGFTDSNITEVTLHSMHLIQEHLNI